MRFFSLRGYGFEAFVFSVCGCLALSAPFFVCLFVCLFAVVVVLFCFVVVVVCLFLGGLLLQQSLCRGMQ